MTSEIGGCCWAKGMKTFEFALEDLVRGRKEGPREQENDVPCLSLQCHDRSPGFRLKMLSDMRDGPRTIGEVRRDVDSGVAVYNYNQRTVAGRFLVSK